MSVAKPVFKATDHPLPDDGLDPAVLDPPPVPPPLRAAPTLVLPNDIDDEGPSQFVTGELFGVPDGGLKSHH
jgi:hypothetical protein